MEWIRLKSNHLGLYAKRENEAMPPPPYSMMNDKDEDWKRKKKSKRNFSDGR